MHIIFLPGNRHGAGRPASLNARHVTAIALAVLLLPALIGVMVYRFTEMLERQQGGPAVAAYRQEIWQARTTLAKTREETTRHLNALAQRLGSLQARILRLNALGGRLTRMAGLDVREFNFDALPAMGGPEKITTTMAASPDIVNGLDALSSEIERSQARLMALESLLLDRRLNAAVTPSAWPIDGGWVSSGFGVRADPFTGRQSMHEGMDIAARFGVPIYATGDGVVSWASERPGYGLLVEVTHKSGLATRYAHASAVLVKVGDRVNKGQEIARVGSTGHSTGPHLHFEVVRNEAPVNPMPFLQQAAAITGRAVVAHAKQ